MSIEGLRLFDTERAKEWQPRPPNPLGLASEERIAAHKSELLAQMSGLNRALGFEYNCFRDFENRLDQGLAREYNAWLDFQKYALSGGDVELRHGDHPQFQRPMMAGPFYLDELFLLHAREKYSRTYHQEAPPMCQMFSVSDYVRFTLGRPLNHQNEAPSPSLAVGFDECVLRGEKIDDIGRYAPMFDSGDSRYYPWESGHEYTKDAAKSPRMSRALTLAFADSLYGVKEVVAAPGLIQTLGRFPLEYKGRQWTDARHLLPLLQGRQPELLTLFGHGYAEPNGITPEQLPKHIQRRSWNDLLPHLVSGRGVFLEYKGEFGDVERLSVSNAQVVELFSQAHLADNQVVLLLNCFSDQTAMEVTVNRQRTGIRSAIGYNGLLPVSMAKDFHDLFYPIHSVLKYTATENGKVLSVADRQRIVRNAFDATVTALYHRYRFTLRPSEDEKTKSFMDLLGNFYLTQDTSDL